MTSIKGVVRPLSLLSASILLVACGSGDFKIAKSNYVPPEAPVVTPPETPDPVPAFDSDGTLTANIRWD